MTVNTSTKFAQLRLGIESGEPQQDGVLVFDDIPVGAVVQAWVNRPVELNEASLTPSDTQPYTFELSPPPVAFTVGGVNFNRSAFGGVPPHSPAGANPSSRQRVLLAAGEGLIIPTQIEPVWAAFGVPVTGSLRQRGRDEHRMVMPGHPTLTPNLAPEDRNFLRMRWAGTPVAAATLAAVVAATEASGLWAAGHDKLVPGSIVLTLPTSGGIMRDNGKGRLVGPDGDGYVNYLTGEWSLKFNTAETGNVLADYEWECLYRPLDVTLTFDPLQAQ